MFNTNPTPKGFELFKTCNGFFTWGQLSFWSNTESPSESLLKVEKWFCLWFVINKTCRHRQYCHHLCPSGQDSGFQDNCRKGPQSRLLNSIFSFLTRHSFLLLLCKLFSPSVSDCLALNMVGQLSTSVGTSSPSGSLSQTSPMPSPSASSWAD